MAAEETPREMELRLGKLLVPDTLVRELNQKVKEHQINKRINYQVKHWYSYEDRSQAPLHVRRQFVSNIKHFVQYLRSCIWYVSCDKNRKMVQLLKRHVIPFNIVCFWCDEMSEIPLQPYELIHTFDHARKVRKTLGLTKYDIKIGFEYTNVYDEPSSSEESSDCPSGEDDKEDTDENMDKDDAKSD